MLGIIVVLVVASAALYIAYKLIQNPDANGDGKVNINDAVVVTKEVAKEVVAEVKAVEEKVVEKVKKVRKPKAPK